MFLWILIKFLFLRKKNNLLSLYSKRWLIKVIFYYIVILKNNLKLFLYFEAELRLAEIRLNSPLFWGQVPSSNANGASNFQGNLCIEVVLVAALLNLRPKIAWISRSTFKRGMRGERRELSPARSKLNLKRSNKIKK